MADPIRSNPLGRDIDQAITSLKKGAYLLKYGRRGKPKFCPFRLSNDENVLIWYSGSHEKQLNLSQVSKIIPGQRTAIFHRYPRPDKEYQSFSLIYGDRSLDLICKDKDEAEAWFVGLKALVARRNFKKFQTDLKGDRSSCDSQSTQTTKDSVLTQPFSDSDHLRKASRAPQNHRNQNAYHNVQSMNSLNLFSDVILYTAPSKHVPNNELNTSVSFSPATVDSICRIPSYENLRVSMSSAVSSSSHGSGQEDFDAMGDVLIWGNGLGGPHGSTTTGSCFLPRPLESTLIFDVHLVACGARHAVLVTKQGEVYSWGEECGGRLGHGVDADSSHPKLITAISGLNIEHVACGEFHTCAVTLSGDLYTWGDGALSPGLLGHGNNTSHWIPKQVCGPVDGLHVSSVSCGPWHTAVITSSGCLYTFGEGAFGALGHGNRENVRVPRLVEALKEMRAVRAACGVWHTAAIVEVSDNSLDTNSPSSKLFTWGDGDKCRLGHGDTEPKLVPACVTSLSEPAFCRVACGHDMTVALCTSGRVYTMGCNAFGQLGGSPNSDGKLLPICVGGNIKNRIVEEISCGAYHVAVLTAKSEVYTWGKGANGRLGHGDTYDRNTPTLVEALKDKHVKTVMCGSDFTVAICLHKWISSADHSICSGCKLPFGFRRKRHNCYNCGLVFCKNCSSRKAIRASLAPNVYKPYRVCDDCYKKLKVGPGGGVCSRPRTPKDQNANSLCEENTNENISRLSSAESRVESRPSVHSKNSPLLLPLYLTGNADQSNNNSNNSSNTNDTYKSSKKIFSLSVPASRVASRSTSPLSHRPSTPTSAMAATTTSLLSPDVFFLGPHQAEDRLTQEVSKLRSQVEELTRKSDVLEEDLERTSNLMREAMARAEEESAKNKAANEVIMSLSNQLKEIREAEHVTDQNIMPAWNGGTPHASTSAENYHHHDHHSNDLHATGVAGLDAFSDQLLSCNCNNNITADEQVVEQVEPGVYITLTFSRIGDKNLKRIRFSRKKFTEEQAEAWWAQNRARLKEKYGIISEVAVRVQDPAVPNQIL